MEREIVAHAPRPVFCVYEHRYRDRAIAEAVIHGRFPIQGVTLELGIEPDWLGAALPADKEWRLEWSKFYYGLNLAAAAEDTRDVAFARAWQQLVLSWIAQVPIGLDSSDVIGRRIQNWLYAWSRFAQHFDLEAERSGFTRTITVSLLEQTAHLEQHLTRERNHRTLELYALFIAALALPHLDSGERLLRFAVAALDANLATDVLADGVQRERSTHYHHVVLRSFLGLRENARRFGLAVPPGFDERLTRACEFTLHCHRPDGTIPALSDSDSGSYLDLLELAGELLDRPDFTYVATRGRSGTPPAARHVSFPHGGYFVQRSGWGGLDCRLSDERYLIFDCGPLGDGGHGHYDALSVEIAANGRPLVIDPGRYTYCDDPPHWRRWFKGTAAHNTATVDGADQTPYRRGKPNGPVAEARLLQRLTGDGIDVMWGQVVSPSHDVLHVRRILFVADAYWLIEDRLVASHLHRYQLRFHLTHDAAGRTAIRYSVASFTVIAPRVALVTAAGPRPTIEDGWVSYHYGTKHAAPVVVYAAEHVADTTFLTLVAPLAVADRHVPILAVSHSAHTCVAHVHHSTGRDQVAWTIDGRDDALPGANVPATVSWRRWSGSGALLQGVDVSHASSRNQTTLSGDADPARSAVEVC
jgi:hypothetical protein